MADTSDLRNGLCIELDGKLYTVVNFLHVKPGKGPAFVKAKLRNLQWTKELIHETLFTDMEELLKWEKLLNEVAPYSSE